MHTPFVTHRRHIATGLTLLTLAHVSPLAAQTARPLPLTEQAIAGIADVEERDDERAQQAAPLPEPDHTGLSALFRETAGDFNRFPRRPSTWIILGIGGLAAAAAYPADQEVNARLQASPAADRFFAAGQVLGSAAVQGGVALGAYLVGRYVLPAKGSSRTNKLSHLGFDLIQAQILSQALTFGIKVSVRRDRPTGECCSFPSGHASATFATASVLERHFGYRAAWPTFVIGGYVAASRLNDNRHFLSDVLFGSALGIASGWTVVGRHGRDSYAMFPVPVRGGMMVTFMKTAGSDTVP
jgi:membrane-associated phospholipid phosphatase